MKNYIIAALFFAYSSVHAGWSAGRSIKSIEMDQNKIEIIVDDSPGGPVEYFVYRFNCGDANCYGNNSDNAKMVAAVALSSLATGQRIKVNYDYSSPGGFFYFRIIQIER